MGNACSEGNSRSVRYIGTFSHVSLIEVLAVQTGNCFFKKNLHTIKQSRWRQRAYYKLMHHVQGEMAPAEYTFHGCWHNLLHGACIDIRQI